MVMKKYNVVIFLLLLGIMAGCSKKERLNSNTLTITLEPTTPQTLAAGQNLSLKAICRSAKSDNVDISPTWSVENNIGTFNPTSGKETVFTAGSSAGTGNIFATFGDIRSAGLSMTVSGGGSGTPSNYYGLYSETYVSPSYSAVKFDIANPPDADGASLGQWGAATLSEGTGVNEKTEGTKGLKCDIVADGGWWVQFGSDNTVGFGAGDIKTGKNMSYYSGGNLKFDVRTSQDINIKIEWTGGSNQKR